MYIALDGTLSHQSITDWLNLMVVAVEVTEVWGTYNHMYHSQHEDAMTIDLHYTIYAMSHQLPVGVLSRKTAATPGMEAIVHMKVALFPATRAKGYRIM